MLFFDPLAQHTRIKQALADRVGEVMARGQFVLGPEVEELETQLSAVTGGSFVVGCSSGSDALWLILRALGIGAGDAVFVPTFTFVASAAAIARVGAVPIFVDVDADTYNISPASLKRAWDQYSKTSHRGFNARAVIAVDLFGLPCDHKGLQLFSDEHELLLIGDAAQSLGASRDGRRSGSLAACTATSFFPSKPLGCFGDGGAVFCTRQPVADRIRVLRNHGRRDGVIEELGWNCRLDTLQAAVLLEKLKNFDDERVRRTGIAARYAEGLQGVVRTPSLPEGTLSAWAQYTVALDHPAAQVFERRRQLVRDLAARGVPTRIYYEHPLHLEPALARFSLGSGSLPVAEDLSCRVLSLPVHSYLKDEEVEFVIASVKDCLV